MDLRRHHVDPVVARQRSHSTLRKLDGLRRGHGNSSSLRWLPNTWASPARGHLDLRSACCHNNVPSSSNQGRPLRLTDPGKWGAQALPLQANKWNLAKGRQNERLRSHLGNAESEEGRSGRLHLHGTSEGLGHRKGWRETVG